MFCQKKVEFHNFSFTKTVRVPVLAFTVTSVDPHTQMCSLLQSSSVCPVHPCPRADVGQCHMLGVPINSPTGHKMHSH